MSDGSVEVEVGSFPQRPSRVADHRNGDEQSVLPDGAQIATHELVHAVDAGTGQVWHQAGRLTHSELEKALGHQLASCARRRVRGSSPPPADVTRQRRVVDAYLAATRDGDFEKLLAILDPDVVLRADRAAGPTPEPVVIRGAGAVAKGAMASAERARYAQPALVDGAVGLVMAPGGELFLVLGFAFSGDTITCIDVIADSVRLREVELAVLDP